jgi:hypothetical protein
LINHVARSTDEPRLVEAERRITCCSITALFSNWQTKHIAPLVFAHFTEPWLINPFCRLDANLLY